MDHSEIAALVIRNPAIVAETERELARAIALLRRQPFAPAHALDTLNWKTVHALHSAPGHAGNVNSAEDQAARARRYEILLAARDELATIAERPRNAQTRESDQDAGARAVLDRQSACAAANAPPAPSFAPAVFISALAQRGISVGLAGDKLTAAPASLLNGYDRSALSVHRAAIIAALSTDTAVF